MTARFRQPKPVLLQLGIAVGWEHQNQAGLQHGSVLGRRHLERRNTLQQLHHLAGMVGSQMLGDHIGATAALGQPTHQRLQGLQPPRRGSDRHHMLHTGCHGLSMVKNCLHLMFISAHSGRKHRLNSLQLLWNSTSLSTGIERA